MRSGRGMFLLAVLAAGPVVAQAPLLVNESRTIRAARRDGPIQLDGRMDEPAWRAAELGAGFKQLVPDEGNPATVETRFRVLWDDQFIYVGVECDDPEPPTATLSRRDRFVEGDWVSWDFDTTFDRRTAYHYQVYASGQQIDGLHFDDTNLSTDWDGPWDAEVARTRTGWSLEARIPLRLMRIPQGTTRFGFNLYRRLSRRQEEDQWRFRPRNIAGDISQLGVLAGLDGIHPVRALELRPYVSARATRTVPAPGAAVASPQVAPCTSVGLSTIGLAAGCVGADLRYTLASDLALVATINPDFGQVEADQRVLNLSTFETFFPEKRPFFLEGMDLFQTPLRAGFGGPYGGDSYQIFYSRRIGRTPVKPDDLTDDDKVLYMPPAVPVATAAKLTGTIGSATSLGLLTALEPRVQSQVLFPVDGLRDVRVSEARSSTVLRLRRHAGTHAIVGAMATASDPLFARPSLGLNYRRAHVGSFDLSLFDAERDWNLRAQVTGSLLTQNLPDVLRDGTILDRTASGGAVGARVSKEAHSLIGFAYADWLSPTFDTNDLGFMRRANLFRGFGYVQLRDVHPGPAWQQAFIGFGAREVRNANLDLLLERDAVVEGEVKLNSFWAFGGNVFAATGAWDDRELGDGTPFEKQGWYSFFAYLNSDTRRPVQVSPYFSLGRGFPVPEHSLDAGTTVTLRPMPQFEASIDSSLSVAGGTLRRIRKAYSLPAPGAPPVKLDKFQATSGPREYLVADQHFRTMSTTLRATYAFTPKLTLQAYAQLFHSGVAYGDPLKLVVLSAGKPRLRWADAIPATAEDLPPVPKDVDDYRWSAFLNLNVILRWEWRTGSAFYLVYAHQTSNDRPPEPRGLDFWRELGVLGDAGVTHGDTLLAKIDVLSAF